MIHVVRIPWSLPTICRADYYGYRLGLAVGPFIVFVWRVKE